MVKAEFNLRDKIYVSDNCPTCGVSFIRQKDKPNPFLRCGNCSDTSFTNSPKQEKQDVSKKIFQGKDLFQG